MPHESQEFLTAVPGLLAEIVDLHGTTRIRVRGSSMLPTLRSGDVIIVGRCAVARIQPGEVVLAVDAGRLIAHRVVSRRDAPGGAVFTLRGDAHWACDPPIDASRLVGRVDAVERDERTHHIASTCSLPDRAIGISVNASIAFLHRLRAIARHAALARALS